MDGRAMASVLRHVVGAVVDVLIERIPGVKISKEFKENLIRRLEAESAESLAKVISGEGRRQ